MLSLILLHPRSAVDTIIPARGKELVKTGLSIKLPHGTYGRVAPRSGLAWKNFIDTGAGVIDEDYRGEVGVLLFNHSDKDFEGKRVLQLGGTRAYCTCRAALSRHFPTPCCACMHPDKNAGLLLQHAQLHSLFVCPCACTHMPPLPPPPCSQARRLRGP